MSADLSLETRGLSISFGGLKVLSNLDFSVRRGERHAIIGPNGAGKTTFVALLTGLLRPNGGEILLDGRDVTRTSARDRVKAGLVRTFQINSLFPTLTPLESVLLALCERDHLARPSLRAVRVLTRHIEEAQSLLEKFDLANDALRVSRELAYGKQRLLEVVLAYAMRPRVLLLDEPAAGLSTAQGDALFAQLKSLEEGTTVLFIEHDMSLVFKYAQRVSVFAQGTVLVQGTADEVRNHEGARRAYLGN